MSGKARSEKLTLGADDHYHSNTMTDPYLDSDLYKFLEERRVTSGRGHEVSMTGMGAKKASWYVSDADYPKFLDLMHDYLFHQKFRPNNFVEQRRPDGITPLLIDLDFAYPSEKSLQRTFGLQHIQSFINEVIYVLKDTFDLKDRKSLRFFVTLRPQPYLTKSAVKKEIKDGVHIVCPDFAMNAELQTYVRHLMLQRQAVKKCFEGTDYVNTDEIVYDKNISVNKTGWFFYGESKPDIPPYLLSHVFKYNTTSGRVITEHPESYPSADLMKLLSIRHGRAELLNVQEKKKEEVAEFLNTMRKPVVEAPAPAPVATNEEVTGMLALIMESMNQVVMTEDEIAMAKKLTECLSPERADAYDTWMRVGWCLRNIDPSDEMFNVWMEFSTKSAKFKGNNVESLRRDWIRGTMRLVNGSPSLKMGSLKLWAREDNPTRYKDLMDGDIISFITKTAMTFRGGTHHHVAKMVHKLFYDTYKCTVDGRSIDWYEFKDHTWKYIPQGLAVKFSITEEIARKVDSARMSLKAPDASVLPADEWAEKNKQYLENVQKLIKLQENLYNANFKDSVMKEAVLQFYDADFHKKINQNPYLLGCANGVLNLREPIFDDKGQPIRYKPTLRAGAPDDYVTLRVGTTPETPNGIEYLPYNAADPLQIELMEFFVKIFPDPELREYVLSLAAGCLEGANKEQCFYIITGSGANGKSKFVDLMTATLGQYAGSLSTTAMTRKRPESGAANPDIISIKGCRFIKTEEPDEGEPLNTARMKQFSGEDLVEARGLFKDQERFKITGKIFLACNRMPPIHSMDGGTWRRIRVIDFPSKFLQAGDPMIDPSRHLYQRDDMMEEKLKRWRVPFFSLLVHYYETKYCPNGIKKVPACVMVASENYKGNFDMFGKFIKARIRRIAGWDDPPTINRFWSAYRSWHTEENPTGKKLTQNELKIRLNELYQAPKDGKTYLHLRLFTSDEEVEEYDKEQAGI